MTNWTNDLKYRTALGITVTANPLATAPALLDHADPAAERSVIHGEPAHFLRKQIERVIRDTALILQKPLLPFASSWTGTWVLRKMATSITTKPY